MRSNSPYTPSLDILCEVADFFTPRGLRNIFRRPTHRA